MLVPVKPFFFVCNRDQSLQRTINLWLRESKKQDNVNKSLRVKFIGEDGIDTGALTQEFFKITFRNIKTDVFPNGHPLDSMLFIHKKTMRTCASIASMSIIQGGPNPTFFDVPSYRLLCQPDVDLSTNVDTYLSENEKSLLEEIKLDVMKYEDDIIQHGYTGIINEKKINDIVGTVKLSILCKKITYLSDFAKGLHQNIYQMILKYPQICEDLFVENSKNLVDSNYILSHLQITYSNIGTNRRAVESQLITFFHDFLNDIEENCLPGVEINEPINSIGNDDDSISNVEENSCPTTTVYKPRVINLTVPDILSWLTGQSHKPLCGDDFRITMVFDHECKIRNPSHTICFPVIAACARTVTFPVTHMATADAFRSTLLLAYSNCQTFNKS